MAPRHYNRTHSGPYFYLAIAVIIFGLYSITVAAVTVEKCENRGMDRTWQVFPPKWNCKSAGLAGYG